MSLSLPQDLITSLQHAPGFDERAFKEVHASGEQVTSVRFNPAKKTDKQAHFPGIIKIPWSTEGYYLSERPSFTVDPLFHSGVYYVQEAGSMFLEEAIRQCCDLNQPLKFLDLCAAPGGKTTLIQSLISAGSLLVSNELIKTRVNILSDNITKWGAANVIVTNNDAKDFQRLPGFFDVIVVDAPCSGSGLFRRDNNAISEWSLNNVALCSARQERILEDILPSLKEDGVLIYSTCSYSEAEDEAIADGLAGGHDMENIRLQLPENSGIVESLSPQKKCYGYRFYPDKIKAEGFYLSAFRKKYDEGNSATKKKYKDIRASKAETETVRPYVNEPDRFAFIKQDENVIVFPEDLMNTLYDIKSSLYIKKAGITAGTVIRNGLIPDHELALSTILSEKLPVAEVDINTMQNYLRRKDIKIEDHNRGWSLISYAGHANGLVKILPGRVNNYYPAALRILNK